VENYEVKFFRGGSGGRAAFFEVDDLAGRVRAKLRGDAIDTYAAVLESGGADCVRGRVSSRGREDSEDEAEPMLFADTIEPLADALLEKTRMVVIRLEARWAGEANLCALRALLDESPGPCPVEVVVALEDGSEAVLALAGTRVRPNDTMLAGLERVFGQSVAELC
jgi:DNA polymerase III alpha subunit